jgi:hypothetical protein
MHWEYSVNTYEESQIAFFTLACLWDIQRFWQRGQTGCLLLAFAMMGASLTFRLSSAVVLIPIGLVGIIVDLAQCRQRRLARLSQWVAAGVVGLGPALAASGIYNYVRFGSPMETGYVPAHEAMGGIKLFSTPFLNGLGGLMVSPGKSVFLYNPVLLLSIIGFAAFWRSQRRLAIMVLAACGATVVFHSKYTFWSGDVAWGPRYLASVMGLCVLPIMPLMQRRMSFLIVPVVIVSIGVQMTSVPYNFVLEYFQDGRHGTIPDDYVWRWQESQLLCRFQNIGRDLAGNPNNNSIPPAHERPELSQTTFGPAQVQTVHTPNIFPFKARLAANGQKLARMLTWLFVAMLAALGATVVLWWRRIEADRSPLSGVAPDNEAQSPGAPR